MPARGHDMFGKSHRNVRHRFASDGIMPPGRLNSPLEEFEDQIMLLLHTRPALPAATAKLV